MSHSRRTVAARSLAMLLLLVLAVTLSADSRYAVKGMVLSAAPATKTFVASIETIPGFMTAMVMPFQVRDARELSGLAPGAMVEFTLVVGQTESYAESVTIKRFETVEQDPLNARRLALMRQIASGTLKKPVAVGAVVPDFRLVDQKNRPFSLASTRGKIVGVNFMYTTCVLPDYCLRIVNHFGALQKRFGTRLGRDLIFLTVTFDPDRDTPDVLERYAAQWQPDPATWHFLTGTEAAVRPVLENFGVHAFPNEGLIDHGLHTAIIDRAGKLVANLEGNRFSTDQLGDLLQAALDARH